jgi:hypothetical protein
LATEPISWPNPTGIRRYPGVSGTGQRKGIRRAPAANPPLSPEPGAAHGRNDAVGSTDTVLRTRGVARPDVDDTSVEKGASAIAWRQALRTPASGLWCVHNSCTPGPPTAFRDAPVLQRKPRNVGASGNLREHSRCPLTAETGVRIPVAVLTRKPRTGGAFGVCGDSAGGEITRPRVPSGYMPRRRLPAGAALARSAASMRLGVLVLGEQVAVGRERQRVGRTAAASARSWVADAGAARAAACAGPPSSRRERTWSGNSRSRRS